MVSHRLIPFSNGVTRTLFASVTRVQKLNDATHTLPSLSYSLKNHFRRNFAATSRVHSVSFLHEAAFIDNELVGAFDGATFSVVNPVNGDVIGLVPDMGVEDTEKVGLSQVRGDLPVLKEILGWLPRQATK